MGVAVVATLYHRSLSHVRYLSIVGHRTQVRISSLVTVRKRLNYHVPIRSLRIQALRSNTIRQSFRAFILSVANIRLTKAVPNGQIRQRIRRLANHVHLVPNRVRARTILRRARIRANFP